MQFFEDVKRKVKVQSYQWKDSVRYVTGYYEFEIITTMEGNIGVTTNFRRFSDIEVLHSALLRHNPGCRIIPTPEKTIWCNLYVNNDYILEQRKKNIEDYLNYINNHPILCKNPIFIEFLLGNFEVSKSQWSKNNSGATTYIFDKIYSVKNYFFSNKIAKEDDILPHDETLDSERNKLIRLFTGISNTESFLENYIKTNDERNDCIKNIFHVAKTIDHLSLEVDQHEAHQNFINMNKKLDKQTEVFFDLYDNGKTHCKEVGTNALDWLRKYKVEVGEILQIFERKDTIEENLAGLISMQKTQFSNERECEKIDLQKLYIEMIKELKYEIENFKASSEIAIFITYKRLFSDMLKDHNNVSEIFEDYLKMMMKNNEITK